jgi:hypothetical protein
MGIREQLIINIALSCVFFVIGFSVASYSQYSNLESSFSAINAIIGVIGMGTALSVAINNWKKVPKLDFDNILQFSEKDIYLLPFGTQYFLRIKNEKKDTLAKSVRGFITIDDTIIDYKPLLWENNRRNEFNIGVKGDLFLFSLEEIETGYQIKILLTSTENREESINFYPVNLTFEDSKLKHITIRIDSENAITPKRPFIITLKDLLIDTKKNE